MNQDSKPTKRTFIQPFTGAISFRQKRIMASGFLAVCIGMSANALYQEDSPHLTWTLLLCSIWGLSVWLWPKQWSTLKALKLTGFVALALALVASAYLGSKKAGESHYNWEDQFIREELSKYKDRVRFYEGHLVSLRDSKSEEELLNHAQILKSVMKSNQEAQSSR